jgi:hypothetical protein
MYSIANTTITILRGTSYDDYGDVVDAGVPVYSGVLAFISVPAQSPFRPIVFGANVFQPAAEMPLTVREITCQLPAYTDVTNEDQVLDEKTGILYNVELVSQQGTVGGLAPDVQCTLRRVTDLQPT